MGNGFLRNKVDKRGINGLMVLIAELLSVSWRKNVISIVLEEEGQEARVTAGKPWHGTGEGGNATDVIGQGSISRFAKTAIIRNTYT